MSKYKGYAPGSEFLAYPTLEIDDIEYDFFRKESSSLGQSLVENKKGRIVIRWEFEFYQKFLKAVEKKYGNIWANNVEAAVRAAVEDWIKRVGEK